jgi:ribosome-binding protein aMBF1 (putative translation factor)
MRNVTPMADRQGWKAGPSVDNVSGLPNLDLGDYVAANVRAERSRRRWTQDQLADRLGWSRQVVTAVESGRRQLLVSDLPALCRAFDVPLIRLLTDAADVDVAALRLGE